MFVAVQGSDCAARSALCFASSADCSAGVSAARGDDRHAACERDNGEYEPYAAHSAYYPWGVDTHVFSLGRATSALDSLSIAIIYRCATSTRVGIIRKNTRPAHRTS